MKFGKYLEENQNPEWADKYLNYKSLKDLIKEASDQQEEMAPVSYSPRTTSLTFQRATDRRDSAEDRFFQLLESEVDKLGNFTSQIVDGLRERLFQLQSRADAPLSEEEKDLLVKEAHLIGDEFLALEKYVNLNYTGFHKILKKHDKKLPHAPCRQFYISHLHNQPWVQGNYSDLLLSLSNVYSQLRGDHPVSNKVDVEEEEHYMYATTKYWVRMGDVSAIKHSILQHLPVYKYSENEYTGDSQVINAVYLDNAFMELYHARLGGRPNAIAVRLKWPGPDEPTVVAVERKSRHGTSRTTSDFEDRFVLLEKDIIAFLTGQLRPDDAATYWRAQSFSEEEIDKFIALFNEVQKIVDAKQLKPTISTQYMRTFFQIPFDPTVKIKLDTNICMIKENPEDKERWHRDPSVPLARTDITRFPHAVLELNLALRSGETTPNWLGELIESGTLIEIANFSKFIHGTAALCGDSAQEFPYWVDDDIVKASMLTSAPDQPIAVAPTARDHMSGVTQAPKPRKGLQPDDSLMEPLLGNAGERLPRPRVQLRTSFLDWWFSKPAMEPRPRIPGIVEERPEPKTYFANERTFLSWLHMALTMGSISAAMLGFSTTRRTHDSASDEVGVIALILLPIALLICAYALLVYHWRAQAIANKSNLFYDDRRGPLALTVAVVAALTTIFLLSVIDLVGMLLHPHDSSQR